MLLFSCMHVEKSYSFLLLCVDWHEITPQDCTQQLLRTTFTKCVIFFRLSMMMARQILIFNCPILFSPAINELGEQPITRIHGLQGAY